MIALVQNTSLEDLESSDVKNADERRSLALGAINRTVDALHDPLEHSFIDCFADCFHGKLHLVKCNVTPLTLRPVNKLALCTTIFTTSLLVSLNLRPHTHSCA